MRVTNQIGKRMGSMEMCAVLDIWNRSMEHKMQYTTVLSDGDLKMHQHLIKNCVYGPDIPIQKEAMNHVAK